MRSAPLGELNGNDPSPGSTQAPNFTALLAARKFRNNVLSAEKRAEKAAFGAKLRAELPPGPLPDSTPPSTSKLLARLMSKDGMTPGDRLRKQEKLAAMQELLEKEKASPIEKAESKTSKTSASNTQTSSSKNIPEESPTTYFAHSVTPVETSGDTKYMGVDMDISENTTVTVPVVKRADEMVAADFTTPVPETKSAPRSPVSPDVSPEEEPHTSESSAEDAARRAHEQERVEAGALAAAQAAELVAQAQARAEAEHAAVEKARAEAREAAAAAAFAEAEAQRMTDELAALRRVAEEEALVEAARLAEEKRLREAKLIAKAAAEAERLAWEKQEAEEELRAEREAREAAIAEAAQTRAAEKEILEQEELARVLAEAEEEAAWQAERVAAAEAKAEAAALRVEAEALERARWEAEEKRVLFEQEARSKAAAAAKLRAKQEAAEGRARAEAEAAKKKAKEEADAKAAADAAEAKDRAKEALEAAARVRAMLVAAEPVETPSSTDAPGTPPEAAPTSAAVAIQARTGSPSPSRREAPDSALASAASAAPARIFSPRSPVIMNDITADMASPSPPWSVRSARTAEEDDELPLHAALFAGADFGLISQLLQIDPGSLFIKDVYGDLPLHVALRAFASSDTIDILLKKFPESSSKKDRNGVTPAQLALEYLDVDVESEIVQLIKHAKGLVRRNAEKLKPVPRAVERVAFDTAVKFVFGAVKLLGNTRVGAVKNVVPGKRASKVKGAQKNEIDSTQTDNETPKSRRRKLFEGEEVSETSTDVTSRKIARKRRAFLNLAAKGVITCGAAYGTVLAATIVGRSVKTQIALKSRVSRHTKTDRRRNNADPSVDTSKAPKVSPEPQQTPNAVEKGTDFNFVQDVVAVSEIEIVTPVALPPAEMVRIDCT